MGISLKRTSKKQLRDEEAVANDCKLKRMTLHAAEQEQKVQQEKQQTEKQTHGDLSGIKSDTEHERATD